MEYLRSYSELKTLPKQILGSLLLDITLPCLDMSWQEHSPTHTATPQFICP